MEHGLSSPGLRHRTGLGGLREILPDSIEVEAILLRFSAQFVCQRFCPLRSFAGSQQLCLHVSAYAGRNPEPDDQGAEETSDENPRTKDRAVNHG
jgi:hypothetical protein